MATFGERLRFLRKQADLTQQQLADSVFLNKQTISQYELGKRQPDYEKLERLCDYFNVTSDYLLGKSNLTVRIVDTEELGLLNKRNETRIPVLGTIAAGSPQEAVPDITEYVIIPENWSGSYGALKVKGDSMLPVLMEGDTVIFRKQDDAKSGDFVIAMIGDADATIKKFVKKRTSVTLVPLNPEYEPVVFKKEEASASLRILGKIVESRRSF